MEASFDRPRPCVALLATGGTIAGAAMRHDALLSAGYQAAVASVDELVSAVPGLRQLAEVRSEQLMQINSADFNDERLLQLARRVAQLCAQPDIDAVVITHGTDTLEESAYFLHLTVPSRKPVVFVGAMRPATDLAADGPANLLHAMAVAAHPSSAGRGVLVVMNEQVHSARDVSKTHTMHLHTMTSPYGPLGMVVEGVPRWYRTLDRPHTARSEFATASIDSLPLVGVVMGHGNARAELYPTWVDAGAQAVVYAGVGAGTVPQSLTSHFKSLTERGVLVVRASRVGAGPVIRNANFDDDACGTVVVDDQNAARARLLTALALSQTRDPSQVQAIFWRY